MIFLMRLSGLLPTLFTCWATYQISAQVPNLEWAKNTAGTAYKESNGITIDPFGNVYVIGTFEGTADFDPGPGLFQLTSVVNSRDFFILKLDPNGHFVWAEAFGGPDSDEGKAITTDAAGNVYVTGGFRGTANFDPDPLEPLLLNSFGNRDAFVAKYDDDGNLIWAKQLGGAGADFANDIKVDGSGNVLTTGYFGLIADFDPGTSVFPMTAIGFSDIFISKLSTNGDFIWAKSVGSPFYEYGYNIAVDPGENVLVSGSFPGSVTIDFDPGPGNFMVTGSGSDNAFVLKLNPAGNFDWVVAYDGTGYSIAEQLAVDNIGNVIVSGPFDGTVDFDPLGAGFPLTAGPMGSLFITKLSPTGSFIWAGSMEGSGIVYYGDITVDVSNAIILAGNFENIVDFDPGPGTFNLTANGSADIFLVKLTDTGILDWAGQLGASGNLEFSYGVASDASGNTYVTGSFVGLLDADPSACVFNLAAIDDFDVFAIKVGTLPGCTPVITDFLPVSGPVGTVVVINGLNFSNTPANNMVEFNGTPAVVTASTTTSITTIVPPGATTGPITVLVLGNAATSATDFTVVPFDCPPTSRTGGALDTSFNPAVEDPADFTTIAMQSNGKSIVATTGIIIGGINYEGLLRFNQDGSVDNTFTNSVHYYPHKGNLLVQPDDKILVVEPGSESYVRRLNPDGSLDNSFNSPAYYASTIYALGHQSDGKVLLSIYDDGVGQVLVYRLNADGTPDGSFAGGDNMASNVIRQQTDGKIVLGGSHGLARLDQFGNVDPSFQEVLFSDDEISDLIIQPDGKIVIVGKFSSIHGVPCENIARLNPDGRVDLTFTFNSGNGFNGPVRAIKRTGDGNLVAAGQFTLYNDEVRHQLALLDPDGNLVCEFDPVGGVDTQIRDLAIQPDGKILIVGDFVYYDGTTKHGFARVLYTSGASITITTQPGGTTNRCEGDNYPFSTDATGTTNITYQWQKFNTISTQFEDLTNGGAYADVTTKNLQINNMQLSESGDYRCRIDGDLAPTVYTDIATLIVNPLPPAPITTDGARCGPGPVIVSAANGSPGDYRWYPDLVAGEPIPGEENDTYTTPALTVTTPYYVSLVNAFCESARIPVNAIVNPVPPQPAIISSITPVGNTVTFCSTNTLTLTAPTGYATYSWSSGETTEQINVTASGIYSVTVTNSTGCSSPVSVALTVNIVPAPCNNQAPVIQSTVAAVPVEGIITINVLDLINDPDDNLDPASLSVVTSTSQQGASASINGSLQLVLDYGGVFFSGNDQVTIQVCDLFGECTQQVLTIEVAGDIVVYNAFSPNGDGKNEIFLIQYINLFPDTQQNRVSIYNRWGDEVFSISNYNNDTRVFRGISNSGTELTTGTYFYKIEFTSGRATKTGYLSLKK